MKAGTLLKVAVVSGFTVFSLMVGGCSKQNPMSPTDKKIEMTAQSQNIKFISFGEKNALEKVTSVTRWINRSSGGSVHIHHISDQQQELIVDLTIPPNSINWSQNVTMQVDDGYNTTLSDIVFGPHGTTFSPVALLTIEAKNIDLSGINPNNLRLFYINENGLWEEHPVHEIVVDFQWKVLRVVAAQIPHFSRYGIGELPGAY